MKSDYRILVDDIVMTVEEFTSNLKDGNINMDETIKIVQMNKLIKDES